MGAVNQAQDLQMRGISIGRAMALALVLGALAGMLFGIHESVMALVREEFADAASSLSSLLRLTGHAIFWNGVLGGVAAALVGLGAWAAARSRRKPLSAAMLLGILAGVMALAFARTAIWDMTRDFRKEIVAPVGRSIAAAEIWTLSGLAAACVGYGVYLRCQRLGRPARPLSFAFALVCGLAAWTCWSAWAGADGPRRVMGMSWKWATWASLAVALALGVGVYQLLLGLLVRPLARARRRAILGGVATAVATAALASSLLCLGAERRRARQAAPDPLAATARSTPNILWIVMDTARADALSCYGNPRKATPQLDQLAAEGALFERAFTNAPWTLPSHASMFTGKLPHEHHTDLEHSWLHAEHVTVAEVLAKCGYATFSHSANQNVSYSMNTAQGFQQVSVAREGRTPEDRMLIGDIRRAVAPTDDGARDANELARRWIGESVAAQQPFFVFINYMEPHAPYGTTPCGARWLPDRKTLRKAQRIPTNPDPFLFGTQTATREEFQLMRALYDGDMTYLDGRIGELVDFLRQGGILDNTLLIVTSDHGEELGEHGIPGHSYGIYNSMLHVPLIIRYPKLFPPATRHPGTVQLIDLFPTILDVLDVQWEGRAKLPGRSLLASPGAAQGVGPATHVPWAIAERELPLVKPEAIAKSPHLKCKELLRKMRAIVTDDSKYIMCSDGHEELYDLRTDFHEANNILSSHPDKARALRAILDAELGAPWTSRGATK